MKEWMILHPEKTDYEKKHPKVVSPENLAKYVKKMNAEAIASQDANHLAIAGSSWEDYLFTKGIAEALLKTQDEHWIEYAKKYWKSERAALLTADNIF